jgi:hypothetical protein
VRTILSQVIDGYPRLQQESIIESFCSYALGFIEYDIIEKMSPDKPNEAFLSLLCHSNPKNLWDALTQTLCKSEELDGRSTEPERQSTPRIKRNLVFIFDLDDQPIETCRLWLEMMRPILRKLRRHFTVVKMLVTHTSKICDVELYNTEVLLIYDKGRQGMC